MIASERGAARGHRDPVVLHTPASELRALAGELAARDPATWPSNLHAEDYNDLSNRMLNHEKAIARRITHARTRGTCSALDAHWVRSAAKRMGRSARFSRATSVRLCPSFPWAV